MELNWKEDNNLVRKIAKILLGDTLPNGEPVSSLVLIDAASRAELQRWADMSDAEFEAARQSGDTIHIDVDDETISFQVQPAHWLLLACGTILLVEPACLSLFSTRVHPLEENSGGFLNGVLLKTDEPMTFPVPDSLSIV